MPALGTPAWGRITAPPVIADGVVYVATRAGRLYAIDAGTGEVRWSGKTIGGIGSSPAVADGAVYLGGYDGQVYAFEAETGTLR